MPKTILNMVDVRKIVPEAFTKEYRKDHRIVRYFLFRNKWDEYFLVPLIQRKAKVDGRLYESRFYEILYLNREYKRLEYVTHKVRLSEAKYFISRNQYNHWI